MIAVYIDVQNTHKATQKLWWLIDWQKLYIYLSDKYKADHIYYAVWYIASNQGIYTKLENIGYIMLYKETMVMHDGQVKGNVDIDIAIRSTVDIRRNWLSKAYLITNDGDYNTLIQFFIDEWVLWWLILSDRKSASYLIKKLNKTILDIQDIQSKIQKIPV
jgi:uncharacterized LabA/DUF88 family protein